MTTASQFCNSLHAVVKSAQSAVLVSSRSLNSLWQKNIYIQTHCMAWQIECFLPCMILRASASHSSVHLPSAFPLSTSSRHHTPPWCVNSQWRTEEVSLYGSATGAICTDRTYTLFCCFHVLPSYSCYCCCFCSLWSYLSTWITPALKHSDRIACMRCFELCLCELFCAHHHVCEQEMLQSLRAN